MAIAGSLEYSTKIDQNGFEKGINSLKTTTNSVFSQIKNMVTALGINKLISSTFSTITGSIDGAISRLDTLNNYPKVMKNIGFSVEEADKSINKLSDGIQGLPTALDEIVSNTQSLAISLGDLDLATDVAIALNDGMLSYGATSSDVTNATKQLNQMISAGKYDMQSWLSVTQSAPGLMDTVAKSLLGASANQETLRTALNDGKVTTNDFLNALINLDQNGTEKITAFKDAVKDATGGMATSITNLKTRITKGVASIIDAFDNWLQSEGFGGIAQIIDNIGIKVNEMLDRIAGKVPDLMGNIKQIVPILITLVAGFNLIDFKSIIENGTIVEKVFGGISKNAKALPETFGKLGKSFHSFGNFGKNLMNGFSTIFSGGMFEKIGNIFSGKLEGLMKITSGFTGKFFTPIKKAFDGMVLKTSTFAQLVKSNIGESFNQAFPNFSSGISKIGGSFKGLFGKMSPMLGNFLPMFMKAFNITAIIGLVIGGLGILQGEFGEEINQIATMMMEQGPTIISNLVNGIVSALPQLIEQGSQLLQTLLNVIIVNLPAIIQGGIQIICALVTGLAQQLPTLIPMALELILTFVMSLLDNIDQLIDAGINLLIGLAEGLINAIPMLIEKIPIILEKLIMAIANNLPKIIKAGIKIIVKLAEGLIKAIPQLVSKIPEIIAALVLGFAQFLSNMWNVGKNIVAGIWDGIKKGKDWLIAKVKEWCGSILNGIKAFFGIHSPSKLMRDEIGKFIPQGIAVGIEADTDKAVKAVKNMNDEVYSKMKNAVAIENASISAKATLEANKTNPIIIARDQTTTINNTQQFYSKESTPYEEQKQAKQQLRRLAYGL